MPTFGENLRNALARTGRDRAYLAAKLEVTAPQVDKWLGASNVELLTIFRVAKALGVSVESLCTGIDGDYDTMMAASEMTPARLKELWEMIPADQRAPLKRLMEVLAGVPAAD